MKFLRGGTARIDEQFNDKVLMPGFVEGHAHTMEGSLWRKVYCGFFDRMDPNGKIWSGVKSLDEIVNRLKDSANQNSDSDSPISGWQFDPIYLDNKPVSRHELDQVSKVRPVSQ